MLQCPSSAFDLSFTAPVLIAILALSSLRIINLNLPTTLLERNTLVETLQPVKEFNLTHKCLIGFPEEDLLKLIRSPKHYNFLSQVLHACQFCLAERRQPFGDCCYYCGSHLVMNLSRPGLINDLSPRYKDHLCFRTTSQLIWLKEDSRNLRYRLRPN